MSTKFFSSHKESSISRLYG